MEISENPYGAEKVKEKVAEVSLSLSSLSRCVSLLPAAKPVFAAPLQIKEKTAQAKKTFAWAASEKGSLLFFFLSAPLLLSLLRRKKKKKKLPSI